MRLEVAKDFTDAATSQQPDLHLLGQLDELEATTATLARLLAESKSVDISLERTQRQLQLTESVSRTGSLSWTFADARLSPSDQLLQLLGVPPDTFLHARALLRRVLPGERTKVFTALRNMLLSGFATTECLVRRGHGSPASQMTVHITGIVERRADGRAARLTLLCRDVTEHQRAAQRLSRSELLRQRMFDASPDGLLIARASDRTIIDVNARFLEETGFTREQIIGRTDAELGLWNDPAAQQHAYAAVEHEGALGNMEAKFRLPNGRLAEALIAVRTVEVDGETLVIVTVRNVTEYKNTLRALAESEARFALAFKEAPIPAFIVQKSNQRLIDANDAFFSLIPGIRNETLDGTTVDIASIAHPDDRETFAVACTQPSDQLNIRFVHTGSRELTTIVSSRATRFRGEDCCIVFAQDVSARANAEQRFGQAIDTNPDGALVVDLSNDQIIRVNAAFAELAGLEPATIVGHTAAELRFWQDPSEHERFRQRLKQGPVRRAPALMRHVSGTAFPVDLSASTSIDGDGQWLMVTVHDRRHETAAEQSLRSSQERFEKLFRTAPLAMALYRQHDSQLIDVNPEYEALFGVTSGDLQQRNVHPSELWSDPSDYEHFVERLLRHGEVRDLEAMMTRAGPPFHALISARALSLDGDPHVLLYIANVDELKGIEAQLQHAQKMEAIGQLAGGVAHDFNNLLSGIQGFTELMLLDDAFPDNNRTHARQILSTVQRAAQLTKQLLIFSRRNPPRLAAVELHDVIHNTVAILERTLDRRLEIVRHLAAADAVVLGDQSQIENALLNLCINARDAMHDGGTMSLSTGIVQLSKETIRTRAMDIKPGTYLRLSVHDTGAGIAPDVVGRIFEPFFTTKAIGRGTGLGLAAVWGMLRAHHAGVQVDTAPGEGTAFHLFFKPHRETARAQPKEPAQHLIMGQGRVLVVDDEASLRELIGTMLRALGYEVVEATDGVHAMQLFEADPNAFDLVVLDMTMPRMNGYDTFAAMHALRADVRVLLTSGYVQSTELESTLALGALGVLNKPFDLSELSREVSVALTRRRRVKR